MRTYFQPFYLNQAPPAYQQPPRPRDSFLNSALDNKPRATSLTSLRNNKDLAPKALSKAIEEYAFNLKDQIGSGLTSKVYKGINEHTKQIVSVKVIDLKQQNRSPNAQKLLESEIRLLRTLSHPNIVQLKQVYQTANNCYIITEFCESGDLAVHLKDLFKKRIYLSEKEAILYLKDILAGFKYLVRKSIIHRDIKPANIFLSKDGTAKLADFGFAMHASDASLGRLNVGSPVYMAPEALASCQYSHKSDIFSIGVLFYELLHSYTPWTCRTEEELLKKMKTIKPKISSGLSAPCQQFLQRCLKADPLERISEKQIFNHELLMGSREEGLRGSSNTRSTLEVDDDQKAKHNDQVIGADDDCYQIRAKKAKKKDSNNAPHSPTIIPKNLQRKSSNNSNSNSRGKASNKDIYNCYYEEATADNKSSSDADPYGRIVRNPSTSSFRRKSAQLYQYKQEPTATGVDNSNNLDSVINRIERIYSKINGSSQHSKDSQTSEGGTSPIKTRNRILQLATQAIKSSPSTERLKKRAYSQMASTLLKQIPSVQDSRKNILALPRQYYQAENSNLGVNQSPRPRRFLLNVERSVSKNFANQKQLISAVDNVQATSQRKLLQLCQQILRTVDSHKDWSSMRRLVDKIAYIVTCLQKLLLSRKSRIVFSQHQKRNYHGDPYLQGLGAQNSVKMVLKVGDFYFKRLICMCQQRTKQQKLNRRRTNQYYGAAADEYEAQQVREAMLCSLVAKLQSYQNLDLNLQETLPTLL